MANTVTIRQILDSPDFNETHVYILGDGSGEETNTVIFDASALSGGNASWQIWEVQGMTRSFTATLKFDQTTPSPFFITSDSTITYDRWEPDCSTPVFNPAEDGTTGDITMDTNGLGSGDNGIIVIRLRKKRSSPMAI
jgi:hypothetical protein